MRKIALTSILICICLIGKSQYNKEIVVEPLLKTDTTSTGQRIIYPHFQEDEITILKIIIPPGASTGWHKHEFPVFAYILDGDLTVELENNSIMHFSKNTSISEVINTFHNGVNKGKENVVLIAFYLGEKGKALSIPKGSINE